MEHDQTLSEQRNEGEAATEPAPADLTAAPGFAPAPACAPVARRRLRGRTVALIAGAAVLGVLAGTVTGYAVQYGRKPTPLPPLAQQQIDTPKALAPDGETTHKTINANRWHKTDDDLGKLLVEAPAGAKSEGTGYETLDVFAADFFEKPEHMVRQLADAHVRRIATTLWSEDDRTFVEVRLIQFTERSEAEKYQKGQSAYMPEAKHAGNAGVAIPGLAADLGHVWVDAEAHEKPGYYPIRGARAIARRGDIVMEIAYYDNRGKVSESDVLDLAKRQLERL
ncbi:hypothetical protein AB0B01_21835 [Streptomyces sp. NPDC044571]|uniref:hypothetical protein n=1 Tax=Streptomyces sp. NPDC044571 TaxID=3155371 RepID=UPI003402696B